MGEQVQANGSPRLERPVDNRKERANKETKDTRSKNCLNKETWRLWAQGHKLMGNHITGKKLQIKKETVLLRKGEKGK